MKDTAAKPVEHFAAGASNTELMLTFTMWIVRLAGLCAVAFSIVTNHSRDRHPALEVTAVIVACVLVAWWAYTDHSTESRARFARFLPWTLSILVVTSGVASITRGGGALIFLGCLAAIGAGAEPDAVMGWTVTALGVLAVECACVVLGSSTWTVLGYPLILLVGLLIGRSRRAYRVQAEQAAILLSNAERLREEQQLVATLNERTRIAREIHDVLAHSLGALGVQIQAARAVLTDQRDIERTLELLDQAHRLASDGLIETRRAIHALRSDTAPLAAGLAELATTHGRRHRVQVTFQTLGDERRLSPEATLALTRVAQESLMNAAKHAAHQPVELRLHYGDRNVTLVVENEQTVAREDEGIAHGGVDGGYGLAGMRERLLLIDGSLSASACRGHWIVTARVPE